MSDQILPMISRRTRALRSVTTHTCIPISLNDLNDIKILYEDCETPCIYED